MFGTVLTWFAAMSWHLWRIATFRPAFRYLGDTGPVVFSFVAVYAAAGFLRWGVLYEDSSAPFSVAYVAVGLLLQLMAVVVLFERRNRSSALCAAVLGASAAFDLLMSAFYLLGLTDSVKPWPTAEALVQLVWTAGLYVQFRREPAEVQRTGYRRTAS